MNFRYLLNLGFGLRIILDGLCFGLFLFCGIKLIIYVWFILMLLKINK